MRGILIAGGILAATCASQAGAQTITFQNNGNTISPQQTVIRDFFSSSPTRTALPGTNAYIYTQNTPGEALLDSPGVASTGFAAVLSGGSYTLNLINSVAGSPLGVQVLSFFIGSLDTYNTVRLNLSSGGPVVLTGSAIVGGASVLTNGTADGRVTYDMGGSAYITSVVFSSTNNSFEFDDIAVAAPEPATWGMMIVGFGLAGFALRRRRRASALATA